MRRLFLFFFTLCLSQIIFAQRHELGIFAGGANVIGDIGKASYINPFPTKVEKGGSLYFPISIGGLYRFNINPQMGFRANISYSKVGAGDHVAKEQYKIDRNKSFKNNIVEGSIMFEYNFFNINDDQETAQSPYIFFGIGAFSAKGREYDYDSTVSTGFPNGKVIEKTKYNTDLAIPFGVGYKVRFNYSWILSFETGIRYANVDYLDYNTGKFTNRFNEAILDGTLPKDEFDKRQFGNMSNKDWYVLTGISLTYSFGRPACYCD
ncbi:DUF6089 family protein [Empedobacter tilapiae]|uniref:DUF6089 domain-containing protein n=1 Tax=Empedobacter tilapiae TaxID=2491114 RepID=A0A4Z1BIJ9_9FLAO|nr:DUF6089 family protein [Empedobacter tilapiae]TGN29224.1 hypothetical protein E4J94_04525 [Empedobacter tilapiae]